MDFKMVLGFLRYLWHFAFAKNRKILKEVIEELSNVENATKNKNLVLMEGLFNTSETPIARKFLKEQFPSCRFHVFKDVNILEKVEDRYTFLQRDIENSRHIAWERFYFVARSIRFSLFKNIVDKGTDIFLEGWNIKRNDKIKLLSSARKKGYNIIFLFPILKVADITYFKGVAGKKLMRYPQYKIALNNLVSLHYELHGVPLVYNAHKYFSYDGDEYEARWADIQEGYV